MANSASESASVNLIKLAVGVPTVDAFIERVDRRRESGAGMQVWTRSFPRRAGAIVAGGSLYWVVSGVLAVRQAVLAIEEDTYDDGSRCTRIDVEPVLVRVVSRPMRPFQGWRYLERERTPPDLPESNATGLNRLPEPMLDALRELCLV